MPTPGPLLITAFGPFGERKTNASSLALRRYKDFGAPFHYRTLPVDQIEAPRRLRQALRRLSPRAVVLLGEAAGAPCIRLETQAWNELDFPIPDIAGRQPAPGPIEAGAPSPLRTRIDARSLQRRLTKAGHPAELSSDPGRYLCNQIYFTALHRCPAPAIFVHLPLETQLPTDQAAQALGVIVDSL